MEIFNEKYKTIVYKSLGNLDNGNYTVYFAASLLIDKIQLSVFGLIVIFYLFTVRKCLL